MAKHIHSLRSSLPTPVGEPKRNLLIASVLGIVTVLAVGVGLMYDTNRNGRAVDASESSYTAPVLNNTIEKPDLEAIGQRLLTPETYTIAVVGDSTGNGKDEWVYMLGERLARLGRGVLIHDWSVETNAYVSETKLGPGGTPVINIWNGSASGKPSQYSIDHYQDLVPAPPDLLLVSHGHNDVSTSSANNVRKIVRNVTAAKSDQQAIVILQNPRVDQKAQSHDLAIDSQRTIFAAENMPTGIIDVDSAYRAEPDLTTLLNPDGYHPNLRGGKLWEQTVATALGLPPG
ncbi:SGNH/GDSL hydrolase family protein [Rhodococcus sp. 14-1411-2a]|uniref:SGNH/GDSL hydrolase family protein n=1 Tax=Rhodococcus sp. 14-1411-2a TaxID=2023151 RepID=UPI0015C5E312|nr:SGNH/GDSL hydrolase family protein [Rhodococcus sp. 14-1411-2a]